MPLTTRLKIGYPLILLSVVEIGPPFVRMIILTRLLDLPQLGFASALTSIYSMFEMVTDIAIFRYVYSVPRAEFDEALAGAQAVSIIRGAVVSGLLLCASPFVARLLSLQSEWTAFALLAPVVFIRSFESSAPKVAERDYQYGGQLRTMLGSNALSLAAVTITAAITHSHIAVIASLLADAIGVVAVSHLVADIPYRLDFRSPHVRRAWKFGYPLMFNGMGLAVSSQADRFLVGAMLGMSALGLYSVVLLATVVPITMVFRVFGTLNLASFYNSRSPDDFMWNVRISDRVSSMIGSLYATSVILLTNLVVPWVFGHTFVISHLSVCLLGLGAFIRVIRTEPFTSVMIQKGRTKRLALVNMIAASSVGYMLVCFHFGLNFEALFAGRLLGEVTSLAFAYVAVRRVFGDERPAVFLPVLVGFALTGSACLAPYLGWAGETVVPTLTAFVAFMGVSTVWGAAILRRFQAGPSLIQHHAPPL